MRCELMGLHWNSQWSQNQAAFCLVEISFTQTRPVRWIKMVFPIYCQGTMTNSSRNITVLTTQITNELFQIAMLKKRTAVKR